MALLPLAGVPSPAGARPVDVQIWTDRGDDAVYQSGEVIGVKVQTSTDAYLLVYEIDSEGSVNLLFPWRRGSGLVPAHETLRLPPEESGHDLVVGQVTGQGFIVAVASDQPFRDLPWYLRTFDPQAASMGYEGAMPDSMAGEEGIDERGRVVGDPYVAMERIRRRVVYDPANVDGLASDYTTYYVHEVVRYPRYLCNDCHRPGYWAWWNGFDPYYTHCSTFDFRVNWSWYWGPYLWTSYVPYYYYVVRTDCPPHYRTWVGSRVRFSSWDGWNRWTDLSGGQLRRYKPVATPVSYTPPPPRGMIWKGGGRPPGFVPEAVRRRTGGVGGGMRDWINQPGRTAGAERPAWRGRSGSEPGARPLGGQTRAREQGNWLPDRGTGRGRMGRPQPGGDQPDAPPPTNDGTPEARDGSTGTRERSPAWRPRGDAPPRPSRGDSPPPSRGQDPPRRQEPPPSDPGYKQPDAPRPSAPPPPPRR
ncbi:MAG TPA: DUF4384 domain-containing protein, partial [Methylomirabilota bacterium]|nr:DUF4384 domain-containing protein [Methylomirabilota bacterium]